MTPEPHWIRSSFCGSNTCVEVARADGVILMRDGKNPGRPALTFGPDEWRNFTAAVERGEFTL